jgi:hypothetical protein
MILHRRDLVRVGEQVLQVTAPARRVFVMTKFGRGGLIEDRLDTSAQPRGRFRLGGPDGPQHFDGQVCVDIGHR